MEQLIVERTYVSKIEELDEFDDEYVYDIGVASENPFFFANDILVHNSCYFSISPLLERPEYKDIDTSNKEFMISLYDSVAEEANSTFPEFMARTFNTSLERGAIIKAGRELVASRGLFIKKKKYGLMMYEYEGERCDIDGKPGKIKAMGLDLKRADTPKFMQEFLNKLLTGVLTATPQEEMYEWIKQFRLDFRGRPGWEKGTPRKINSVSEYKDKIDKNNVTDITAKIKAGSNTKVRVPGHVQAGINWNKLCDLYNEKHATRITDGIKAIVCKLKPRNIYNMDSIAYPIDDPNLPSWFKELPFDHQTMEDTIIDMKIDNLVGVLNWDMSKTRTSNVDQFFF